MVRRSLLPKQRGVRRSDPPARSRIPGLTTSTFQTSDGVEIRYEVVGRDGPVLFACQGGPNNICDTLRRDLAPLAETCRLVFHDYRGSGKSGAAPPDTYNFERIADDVEELRVHLGVESAIVLAHSMGGFVALLFTLRHPTSVNRLALVGTTPCARFGPMFAPTLRALGPARLAKVLAMALRFIIVWSWRRSSPEKTNAMYAPNSVMQEARRELRPRVAAAHFDVPVDNDNSPHLMKALGSVDFRDRLQDIDCPVLVLYGTRDAVMVAGGGMLAAGLPHAEVVVLPDVGHEPFIEAPAETFSALRKFLVDP